MTSPLHQYVSLHCGCNIAALYVEKDGSYFGLEGVDPWDEARDARKYDGPWPVVAHPPCQRWGRFWHGSTRKPHQYRMGADYGCFAAALTAVRNFGGVLEHPKDSLAWSYFGLTQPPAGGGWMQADAFGGWTCCVDQGHYGHFANKRTWLYAVGCDLPSLIWGKGGRSSTRSRWSGMATRKPAASECWRW